MPVLGFVETALLVLDFAIKLIAIGVVPEGRHPSSGNAWLLLILFVPLVGLPLYLLLGSPYVNRRRKLIQREANKSLGEGLSHLPDVTPEAHPTPALASILRMNRSRVLGSTRSNERYGLMSSSSTRSRSPAGVR